MHDPHGPEDRWDVYLRRPSHHAGLPKPRDCVLFYETGNKAPEGREGRKQFVGEAEVAGELRDRMPPKGPWRHEIRCEALLQAPRAVGPAEMLKVLELPPKFPLFALGGLKRITQGQYRELRRRMGL